MNSSMKNGMDNNTSNKKQPGFWTYFAIMITIVGGMLAANVKAYAADSFNGEDIPEVSREFNPDSRHYIMLDQPLLAYPAHSCSIEGLIV